MKIIINNTSHRLLGTLSPTGKLVGGRRIDALRWEIDLEPNTWHDLVKASFPGESVDDVIARLIGTRTKPMN